MFVNVRVHIASLWKLTNNLHCYNQVPIIGGVGVPYLDTIQIPSSPIFPLGMLSDFWQILLFLKPR